MTKRLCAFLLIAGLGLVSWSGAQSIEAGLFDQKKLQQELEIMKGILSTTLGFFARDYQSRQAGSQSDMEGLLRGSYWSENISAFYLYGQGVTFIIPMSHFRYALGKGAGSLARAYTVEGDYVRTVEAAGLSLEAANLAVQVQQAEVDAAVAQTLSKQKAKAALAGGVSGGVPGGVKGGVAGGVPGGISQEPKAPPAPPSAAAAPTPEPSKALEKQEEVRKKLFEAQEKVKKRREEAEQQRQKLAEAVAQVKFYLIEALANHGDSLTVVKPNEYINIVIAGDGGDLFLVGSSGLRSSRQIISVPKSSVVDYKAGRLTLEAFKQKVLQYAN